MNVTAHQEKEKNEEMRKGRRKKNRRPVLKKLCAAGTSAVVQGEAYRKNEGKCPEQLRPSGRPTAISTQPTWGGGRHHHDEAAVDWCRTNLLVR